MAQEQPMHELDHRFLRRLMETELAKAASSEPQSEKDMKRFLEGLRQYFAWQQQGQAEGRWYIAVIEPDHRAYCPVLRDCVATGPGVRGRSPDRPYPGPGGALGAGLLTAPPRPFGSVSSTCARSDNRSRTNRGR